VCHIRERNREEEELDDQVDCWKRICWRSLNKDLGGAPCRPHGLVLFSRMLAIVFAIAETAWTNGY
jgi:hypothetical protein